MTYVRQTRLDKRKKVIIFGLAGIFVIFLLLGYFYYGDDSEVNLTDKKNNQSKESAVIQVVRASHGLQAGEMADAVKFEVVAVPKELVPAGAITSVQQLKNKRVASSIAEKEFLLQADLVESTEWYEEDDRLTEHTFRDEAIPSTVEVGSVVDIKLFRPNNVDDVVVAKAVVVGKTDKTLSFYLNKVEQENIKEANTEGFIFLVQYLDKSQLPSIATYTPAYDGDSLESKSGGKQSFEDSSMKKK
ncbi:MAG: hypothetical protein K0Q99_1145 [Clostridia bacterium]|jgi:hypothetical protein|nr:hypothetical protein [Clostridia bacterium]